MPGRPLLIVEDDIQVASLFSLRLSSLITAVEVRAAPSVRIAGCCSTCKNVPSVHCAAGLFGTRALNIHIHMRFSCRARAQEEAQGKPFAINLMGTPEDVLAWPYFHAFLPGVLKYGEPLSTESWVCAWLYLLSSPASACAANC